MHCKNHNFYSVIFSLICWSVSLVQVWKSSPDTQFKFAIMFICEREWKILFSSIEKENPDICWVIFLIWRWKKKDEGYSVPWNAAWFAVLWLHCPYWWLRWFLIRSMVLSIWKFISNMFLHRQSCCCFLLSFFTCFDFSRWQDPDWTGVIVPRSSLLKSISWLFLPFPWLFR